MSEAKARRNDPATSWEAADTVRVSHDKRVVIWALRQMGIASDAGIACKLRANPTIADCSTEQSWRSRRAELMRDGLVEQALEDDGSPMYRLSLHNRWCRVFRLTSKGRGLADLLFG